MYYDLISYIDYLESKGELIRINEYVNPELEIAEITDRVAKSENGGKALLFMNTGYKFPALTNAFGSDNRIAYALGVSKIEELLNEIDSLFKYAKTAQGLSFVEKLKFLPQLNRISGFFPKTVKIKTPSCQEVVMPLPKMSELPALKCWPCDGGRFITLPLVHTKNPLTGQRNVGMYRVQIFDDSLVGMHWHRHKTGARHFAEYKKAGKLMPVAVTMGGDPAYTWCATAPLPENVDEYLFAGFLRKKPVRMVKCLTQNIEVPEDSDFVIEGYIDPEETFITEGPFGDHTGFYSLQDLYPRMHVTCISHRRGAVYPATVTGIPPQEDLYISKAIEKIFLKPIQICIAPEIADMYLPEEGVSHNIAIISINKTYPGQAIKIANAMWGAGQMMFCKVIVVTDSNVDIHNTLALFDAIGKNWTPASDTYFSKGPLDVLDHAARQQCFGGKLCIDATVKLPEEELISSAANNDQDLTFLFCNENNIPTTRAKLKIIFDNEIDTNDFTTCIWLAGANTDIAYDCEIKDNSLIVDARAKINRDDFHRPWPNIVCSDEATIESIDKKWESLKIGDFIPSPSLKYKRLEKQG
ncbi:MAG: menaquinone biosynthesis decarboxylase [Prevotellaceae bacterium]|jgi:4-hydroxy-3-polyprenylbenzoate decarboxylase|nr:menaquinone biosynthesis decarboxylase [Prevotellaceae bacterium]